MTSAPPEILKVKTTEVACDGGGDMGHPKVYLNMGDEGAVECPYCDRMFVLEGGPKDKKARK